QPQRHVHPAAESFDRAWITQQFLERVVRSLRLQKARAVYCAERTDDAVAGADEDTRIGIDRASAVLELADEALVKTGATSLPGFMQPQISGEQLEQGDREVADDGLLDSAEPTHEPGKDASWHPVRDHEIHALLMEGALNQRG